MLHPLKLSLLGASLLVSSLVCPTGALAAAHGDHEYVIVKATEARVWRLNTRTGEIAVCSLDDEQLICITSAQALTPPPKTYAELEAERLEQARANTLRRDDKRKRQLAMIERMMGAFRDLAAAGSNGNEVEERAGAR